MAAINVLPIAILINLYSFFIYYTHLYKGFYELYTGATYIHGFKGKYSQFIRNVIVLSDGDE